MKIIDADEFLDILDSRYAEDTLFTIDTLSEILHDMSDYDIDVAQTLRRMYLQDDED